ARSTGGGTLVFESPDPIFKSIDFFHISLLLIRVIDVGIGTWTRILGFGIGVHGIGIRRVSVGAIPRISIACVKAVGISERSIEGEAGTEMRVESPRKPATEPKTRAKASMKARTESSAKTRAEMTGTKTATCERRTVRRKRGATGKA